MKSCELTLVAATNRYIYNIYDLETSDISIWNMALSSMTVLHWTEGGTAHGGVNPGAHGGDSAVEAVLCILATIWLQINVFIIPIKEILEVRHSPWHSQVRH